MNTEYSDLDKLAAQFDFPKKPKLGTVSSWVLILFFALLGAVCVSIRPRSSFIQKIWLLGAFLAAVCFVALMVSLIREYWKAKKEYVLAQTDFESYRQFKALQFIAQNETARKDDALFVEWMEEHPQKKLPSWVKEAIRYGNSLALQDYLKMIEEHKSRMEG